MAYAVQQYARTAEKVQTARGENGTELESLKQWIRRVLALLLTESTFIASVAASSISKYVTPERASSPLECPTRRRE
jgi:hypothetical protein